MAPTSGSGCQLCRVGYCHSAHEQMKGQGDESLGTAQHVGGR